jgi:uncharacterized protein YndB with AHSA1/START domain
MSKVTVTDQIDAPVERVFGAFTDIDHAAEQVESIKEIEMLTTRGFELGARWRETREVMGRLDTVEMEVTEYEKNKSYTITHHKGGATGAARIDTRFTFEPSGSGTKVTVEFDLESPGMPPGMLAPFLWMFGGKVREVLSHDLADLKEAVQKQKA